MKKAVLSLLFLFLYASASWAWMGSMVQAGGGKRCAPWDSDANVTFSWKATSTTSYDGCDGSGNTVTGSTTGDLTIVDDSGTFAILIDYEASPTVEYISWDNTNDVLIDPNSATTLCLKTKISANPAATYHWVKIWDSGNAERIWMRLSTAGSSQAVYDGETSSQDVSDSGTTTGSYQTIAYSWETSTAPTAYAHAVDNDGGSSYVSATEIISDMSLDLELFQLGRPETNGPASGETVHISQFAVVGSYQANCDNLTGW